MSFDWPFDLNTTASYATIIACIIAMIGFITKVNKTLLPWFKYLLNMIKDKKIKEVMINPLPPRHILEVVPNIIKIDKESGFATFFIKSDTEWNITVNQSSKDPLIKSIKPLNGNNNTTVKVVFRKARTMFYEESSLIVVNYTSWGYNQTETVLLKRKNLPR